MDFVLVDLSLLVVVFMQVEEITLNATIVRRSDGGRMWYSNTKLAASNLINVSRSDAKCESFKVVSSPLQACSILSAVMDVKHACVHSINTMLLMCNVTNTIKHLLHACLPV